MKLFRKRIALSIRGKNVFCSPEDDHVLYVEMPDGLRLRFWDGEYDGWYLP